MSESERLGKLRHDLSNPLSALLAEIQLLLLNESQFDPETLTSLGRSRPWPSGCAGCCGRSDPEPARSPPSH